MADAVVSVAVEKLTQVVGQQLSLFAGATHELENLSYTFQSIQAVLADAESRQVGNKNVQLWLSRLRHVAHDVEDLLEDGRISGLGEERDDDGNSRNKACACLLSPYNNCLDDVVSRCKVARRMKEIMKKLDQIADDKNRYGFTSSSNVGGDHRMLVWSRPLTTSLVDESEMMIGREKDKETMISRLVSGSSHKEDGGHVHVVTIVGLGGLGKTTLARQIYHDGRVQDHFNKAVYWVCVSEVFDDIRLTKAILEQVKRTNIFPSEPDTLQKELLEALRGKRFLLVLDDVWNDDAEKWKMLRPPLNSGAKGSRILVTTRSEKVANAMNAVFIHELRGLSDDHSWELFRSSAFAGRKVEEYLELENVGRKIVNKCKGVPLSIKVISGAMNSKRTFEDWNNVLNSKTWSLPQVTDKILPALWLSYYTLPPHLKQCFAYCSIFPKDWVFEKDILVRLWVAQGFIRSEGNREMEDIGADYFDDLVALSMFQQVEKDGETIYTMHDLLHDLAEFIAKDEIYTFICSEGGKSEECPSSSNVRHAFLSLAGTHDKPSNIPFSSGGAKKMRTLWLHGVDGGINSVITDLFHQARFLRALYFPSSITLPQSIVKLKHLRYLHLPRSEIVELPNAIGKLKQLRYLDLSYSNMVELPNAIGEIKHLRYLDLSWLKIVELPEPVSHLHNLRTLNLTNCVNLKKLPRGIGEMISLRHLEIEHTNSLECLPKGLGRITCLQSLSKFIVGGKGGCGIDELQGLNSLEGSLEIQYLERVSSQEEAEKAQLWNKPRLCKLVLRTSKRRDDDAKSERMDSVLEGLRPHANLRELVINCNNSSRLPSWIKEEGCSSLPNLRKLRIKGFFHCENMPGLGKLPELKYLCIKKAGVKKVGLELYCGFNSSRSRSCDVISAASSSSSAGAAMAFPKLEEFRLGDMYELEEWELTAWTSELADAATIPKVIMPCLHKLELYYCPKLEGLPHHLTKAPLTQLRIEHCKRIKGTGCFSFPLLETFTLIDSSEFFFTGLPDLPKLKTFEISGFRKETLPDGGWERLVALQKLEIGGCYELKSLPDGLTQLQSLEHLKIFYCHKLESLPEGLGQLKKLKSLIVKGLETLTCLPDSLGQLESLELLAIYSLEKLQLLPHLLGQLKALKELCIYDCRTLGSLPHGLHDLSLLQVLQIDCCPLLSKRCKREGGVDWPKISHIPYITIDDEWLG